MTALPPKPPARPDRVSLWRYLQLFRADILSAQPARLYRARMAEFRTPFFRSYLCNDPALVARVLKDRPEDFPKSNRLRESLAPLLGQSVFVTNGETWARQRRIIDPAFEGGRLRESLPAIWGAGRACLSRLQHRAGQGPLDIETETSHAAADAIFRAMFSVPITDATASTVFQAFHAHQRAQPMLNLGAFLPLPRWMPRLHGRTTRGTARQIRALITGLVEARVAAIAHGTAPDDLATRILTTVDPETGAGFDTAEMVDQVAIFFLAGHETSASSLAWALLMLALHPDWQARVAQEAEAVLGDATPDLGQITRLETARAVFRETLRLYPPVPMYLRETTRPETFRNRPVRPGAQIVISPWHLHRHERLWENPDSFDPARWQTENGRTCQRQAFIPFSAGPRACPGAGFAMVEGPLLLAQIARTFHLSPVPDRPAVPVAHLTVRSKAGIWLQLTPRTGGSAPSA